LTAEEAAAKAEREKEEKQMTLDEYMSTRKALALPRPELRKAGEGEDPKLWAGYIAAKSDKAAEDAAKAEKNKEKPAKPKETKAEVKAGADMLRFKSEAQRRERERRDDRRDDRRGPGGPPRETRYGPAPTARRSEPAFNLEGDFPALKA